tara:strand:+ start:459 stop:866 length:408 start_codon:yes stop_codon:yes gene_type:complete
MNDEFNQKTIKPLYGERIISDSKIICFDNPNKSRTYQIIIDLPEFTCKCPFSGYPDFAKLKLNYQPNEKVYELKSLKLYINNFRDQRISHEEVINKIMDDLISAADPQWIYLIADFNPRGNVSMRLELTHGNKLI